MERSASWRLASSLYDISHRIGDLNDSSWPVADLSRRPLKTHSGPWLYPFPSFHHGRLEGASGVAVPSTGTAPKVCAVGLVTAALLSGCATPTIETQFTRPKTVAIVDFPDAKPAAIIGFLNARWPQIFFLGPADPYFVPAGGQFDAPSVAGNLVVGATAGAVAGRQAARANDTSKAGGTVAGAAVGFAVGALIDASAQATQKKAEGFPAEVQTAMPGLDIRTEVLGALRKSLEAKGIAVSILEDSRNLAPRLRWPATTKDGKPIEVGELANSPPVEADIVAQVVPLVVYASPGPLNNYNSIVGIGVALYEGRTRKFLGWQAFQSDQNKLWYARYDSLIADIRQAAPAQHSALMSLIPQVSDAISGAK